MRLRSASDSKLFDPPPQIPATEETTGAATEPIEDLPLFPEAVDELESADPAGQVAEVSEAYATTPVEERFEEPVPAATVPVAEAEETPASSMIPAPMAKRVVATGLDAAALASALIVLMAGAAILGVSMRLSDLPLFLPTWMTISLLYFVTPLVFWGKTPGMTASDLQARDRSGGGMTLVQAGRRWLVFLATVGLLGLPELLGLRGQSLADRASGTTTWWLPR